jgi:hypothetical protein
MPAIDQVTARSSVKVSLVVAGATVGRVQSINASISNNMQVLNEIGTQFAVEMKKGITTYSFSIARFFCRADAFEDIKLGQPFALEIQDTSGVATPGFANDPNTQDAINSGVQAGATETLESFQYCAINTISRDYTVGQAVVAENASVVVIGMGIVAAA